MNDHLPITSQIAAERRARKISQATLASRAGTSQAFLSRVERGDVEASPSTEDRLAAALGMRVGRLLLPEGSRLRVGRDRPALTAGWPMPTLAPRHTTGNTAMSATVARVDAKIGLVARARPLSAATLASLRADFRIRYAHETTALEGNTLTLRETQVVLEDGITVRGKPLRDHVEVRDAASALDLLDAIVAEGEPLTIAVLLEIQDAVLAGTERAHAGRLRRDNVRIAGSRHLPPRWEKVGDQVALLLDDIDRLEGAGQHPIHVSAYAHHRLVHIHPFMEGNGRTARLLASLLLLRRGYVHALYTASERAAYLEALEAADDGDLTRFVDLTAEAVERTVDLYLSVIDSDIE